MSASFSPGLEGVVAAQTRLSRVDGQAGELVIRGLPVEVLATRASYEEAAFLLWFDRLPDGDELAAFSRALADRRVLPVATLDLVRAAAAQNVAPMDALCMAAGTLGLRAPGETLEQKPALGDGAQRIAEEAGFLGQRQRESFALVARFPTAVAAYWRMLNQQEPVAPRAGLSHTANYLYMMSGVAPNDAQVRALETYLVALIDHGLNTSTLTARTIISSQSDLVAALTGAVGALKGPLHGGAPGPALQTVLDIESPQNAEPFLRAKLDRGTRLMGFGHRDYKVRDPRTYVLSAAAEQVYRAEGRLDVFDLATQVEQTAVRLLAEYKPGRNLHANVEFYAGLLMHGVGLPAALFTPTFAVARTAGWVAHCLEQLAVNRLISPQSVYEGATAREWVPLEKRSEIRSETSSEGSS